MELIMRFMTFEYVFLIDIQKMFLSIVLELKSDRDMLRLVWGLPRQQLKHYRIGAQRLINLEIPVLVRSLKSSNVELG